MRCVQWSNAFKRDLKRESKGKYRHILDDELGDVIETLAYDGLLSYSYHDHPLIGNWSGSRECHLAFNLVLIYTYKDDDILILERLGTHSEVLGL
ncbi:MAG: type II toxin-antitoxin system YafQ family toxin [Synergistaceae bacterium]|nr:type II toxin-antitoxin system YafQ family toxin [Synergistaceae bacterium]MBR0075880.1 type II toxin-antitoxin system YafQ family toxin [Synergistaceae bacterium]MBR0252100.1 type II toxin-antitoxin system YafQ family toxin [Synergistaceae bacterium]